MSCTRAAAASLAALWVLGTMSVAGAAPLRPAPATGSARAAMRGRAVPDGDLIRELLAEVARTGWYGAQVARIPSGYQQSGGEWKAGPDEIAALHADLDGDGRLEWVLGCYSATDAGPGVPGAQPILPGRGDASLSGRDDRARIVLFRQDERGDWRLLWRSPGLGHHFGPPAYNLREVNDGLESPRHLRPPLSLVDIEQDGRPEIVYQCWSESAAVGALPGVLRYDGRRWLNVAPQGDRFSLQDLDRDGRMEVVTASRYVGYGSGDDDLPRVWRWSGQRYQEASGAYPRFYAALAERYTAHVHRMHAGGVRYDSSMWERAIQKANSLAG